MTLDNLHTEDITSSNGHKVKSMLARIQSAKDIASSIPLLIKELKDLWDCEAITLFALDRDNRQLFSRNKIIDSQPEIRVDISTSSLAGYVAAVGKAVNIADAYSQEDLAQFHPKLSEGSTLDSVLSIRTRSLMVLPIPHNKKLVGVLEVIHRKNGEPFSEQEFKLAREVSPAIGQILSRLEEQFGMGSIPMEASVTPEEGLHRISQAIHSAKNIDEILIELKDSILKLFESQAITIYAVDHHSNEIFSKVKSGDQISEIRLPISPFSIAGWVAMEQKNVNISDVYNSEELVAYHPDLRFDSSWDKQSGNITKSIMGYPMLFSGKLMGVVQVVNKLTGGGFTEQDEKSASIIAETLALAFHNQAKYVEPKPTKFSYLIQNGIITDEELTLSTAKARKGQMDLESVLMIDLKIKRKDLGKSLESFYRLPHFSYSDTVILPSEIMTGLNRNFLTKNF
jgi:GAF domain-containing protein